MELKTLIVVFVCLSLMGSVAWVLPTPLQRAQAKIRKMAMAKGIKVNVSMLKTPREKGKIEARSHLATSYGIPKVVKRRSKDGMFAQQKEAWEIFKTDGLNTKGLPTGWCWHKGESSLSSAKLSELTKLIERLPSDVYAVGVTPIMAHAYWDEKSTPKELDELESVLKELISKDF